MFFKLSIWRKILSLNQLKSDKRTSGRKGSQWGNILGLYCCGLILVSSSSLWDWVTCQRESVRLRNVEDWVLSSSAHSAPVPLILDQGPLAGETQLLHYAKPTWITQHLTQLGLWLWPFIASTTQTTIDLHAQRHLSFMCIFKNKTKRCRI